MKRYRAFGLETGRIYAEGGEGEVRRILQRRFPSFKTKKDSLERTQVRTPIYPERIYITRIC